MSLSRWTRITTIAIAGLLVAALSGAAIAQTPDPVIGAWKINLAKSKYSPGPAPKSLTLTYTAAGQGVKVVVDGVGGDGSKTHFEYTANYDGKDYPVTGNPDADTAALKRVSATTVEIANKKGGKPTTASTRVLSADGKTLTVTTMGTDAQGQKVNNVQVFEKA